MNGIFHAGPTMLPLFQMYMSGNWLVSLQLTWEHSSPRTLIVCDKQQEQGDEKTVCIQPIIHLANEASSTSSEPLRVLGISNGRGPRSIAGHIDVARRIVRGKANQDTLLHPAAAAFSNDRNPQLAIAQKIQLNHSRKVRGALKGCNFQYQNLSPRSLEYSLVAR